MISTPSNPLLGDALKAALPQPPCPSPRASSLSIDKHIFKSSVYTRFLLHPPSPPSNHLTFYVTRRDISNVFVAHLELDLVDIRQTCTE